MFTRLNRLTLTSLMRAINQEDGGFINWMLE